MKTDQSKLSEFKKSVRNFLNVIESVNKIWDEDKYTSLQILVQNLGFDGKECQNYDTQKEVVRCMKIIKALRNIAEYDRNCHYSNWIASECDMLFDGHYYYAN